MLQQRAWQSPWALADPLPGHWAHRHLEAETVGATAFLANLRSSRRVLRSCYEVTRMDVVASGQKAAVVTHAAFAEFYQRAVHDVFGYLARGVFGDRGAAEDLTQETFAAAVFAARTGKSEALSLPWVMGIARHKLIDHYRRASRDERHLAQVWTASTVCDEFDDLDSSEPARVLEMLRHLSREHQLVLLLKYVDDLPVNEIAASMNRSVDATNSLLSRARKALASSISEQAS